MAMDYFRRPVLAGANLPRTQYATVRGSKRRSDPDGTSTVPYFPGVTNLMTLILEIQAVSYTATLSSSSFAQILADINTAISAVGKAFDAGGCLGLSSKTLGQAGSIKVTGGTAAELLGFDLVSNSSVAALGGEVASSPEGLAGNWHGVAFPRKSENFTMDSITRVTGRLAGNMDVLFSDLARGDAKMQFVTTINAAATTAYAAAPAAARIFNGLGLLSRASTKEDLAPFFLLLDTVTKQVTASRVVAVVKGSPSSTPPPAGGYADTLSWSANDGGNVLGLDLEKVPSTAISKILENRTVVCDGATFVSSGVAVGDFVSISGATNTGSWSHNGYRWVIEAVRSETALVLRPMSTSELAQVGTTVTDVQPVLELNGSKSGAEVFGNLVVKTGPYTTSTTFVFDPPIPNGASYELWAAQPLSHRTAKTPDEQKSLSPLYRDLVSNLDPAPNGILSGLDATLSAGNVAVSQGYIRLHGKIHHVPAQTLTPAQFVVGTNYVYVSDLDGRLSIGAGTTWRSLYDESSSARGHLVAEVEVAIGPTISTVENLKRQLGEKVRAFTVGTGGQFATLEQAAAHVSAFASAWAETTALVDNSYPHVEIVVVSNITVNAEVLFTNRSVSISGLPGVVVTIASTGSLRHSNMSGILRVRDLRFVASGYTGPLFRIDQTGSYEVVLERITGGSFEGIVLSPAGATITSMIVDRCNLTMTHYGFKVGTVDARISISRSEFGYSGVDTNNPTFILNSDTGPCEAAQLTISNCSFASWSSASTTIPVLVNGGTTGVFEFTDNFVNASLAASANSLLIKQGGKSLVSGNNVYIAARFFEGTSADDVVSNNTITARPAQRAVAVVSCATAIGNQFVLQAPSVAANEGTALLVTRNAAGNLITGQFSIGIVAQGTNGVTVASNSVRQTTTPGTTLTGIKVVSDRCIISGNIVFTTTGAAGIESGCIYLNSTNADISGNSLYFGDSNIPAIEIDTGADLGRISDNLMYCDNGTFVAANLDLGTFWSFVGNRVRGAFYASGTTNKLTSSGNQYQGEVTTSGTGRCTFSGDIFSGGGTVGINLAVVSGCSFNKTSVNISLTDCAVSGCELLTTGLFDVDLTRSQLSACHVQANNVRWLDSEATSSHFAAASFVLASTCTFLHLSDSYVNGATTFNSGANLVRLLISGCYFDDGVSASFSNDCVATITGCRFNSTFSSSPVQCSSSFFLGNVTLNDYSSSAGLNTVNHRFSGSYLAGTASILAPAHFWATEFAATIDLQDSIRISDSYVAGALTNSVGSGSLYGSNTTFSSINLKGIAPGEVMLSGCYVVGTCEVGMNAADNTIANAGSRVHISNCYFGGNTGLAASSAVFITNCTVAGTLRARGSATTSSVGINNCRVTSDAAFAMGKYRVSDCHFFAAVYFEVAAAANDTQGHVVGNIVDGQLSLLGAWKMVVTGNVISGGASIGLYIRSCERVTVTGNQISVNSLGAAIHVSSAAAGLTTRQCKYVKIDNNFVEQLNTGGTAYAVSVANAFGTHLTNNNLYKAGAASVDATVAHFDTCDWAMIGGNLQEGSVSGQASVITQATCTKVFWYSAVSNAQDTNEDNDGIRDGGASYYYTIVIT